MKVFLTIYIKATQVRLIVTRRAQMAVSEQAREIYRLYGGKERFSRGAREQREGERERERIVDGKPNI